MSGSKHTPGPWFLTYERTVGVARMYWLNRVTSIGTPNKADAVLAAASEQLLEAMRELCEAVEGNDGSDDALAELSAALDFARKTIAKATGATHD